MEIGGDKSAPGGVFRTQPQNIPVASDAALDFPVIMVVSSKYTVLYVVTKMGYLFMYDVYTGHAIYRTRMTSDVVFSAC